MDDSDDSVNNMVSNLPLLFANGYPTSLEKITETQIQKFIPFMVQCSLGNINVPGKEEYNEPEWWPEDIEFTIPITRPKKFHGDWLQKMKEIVKICYQFHKSIFLLRFCNDLAAYEHTWLRFINNHNSTTSLYDRRCNKLLVTFRNENMTYDQPPQKRICLLQQKTRTQNDNNQQQMVEQSLFDIYLCDNCDAELYSSEAYKEHEKICTDDDDVIFCNSTIPVTNSSYVCKDEAPPTLKELNIASEESCRDFLLNFQLFSKKCIERTQSLSPSIEYHTTSNNEDSNNSSNSNTNSLSNNNNNNNNINNNNFNKINIHKNKNNNNNNINNKLTKEINNPTRKVGRPRVHNLEDNIIDHHDRKTKVTRNNRSIYALTRCPNIPFSSPAGQLLIRTFRSYVHKEYLTERLDRVERFCATPILQSGCPRPIKFFGKQRYSSMHNINCTYKKPQENSTHKYVFPRRQYFSQYRADSLKFLNDLILKKRCRPITVRLRKITDSEIRRKRRSSFSSNNSIVNSDLNIKLIRDQSHGSTKWKITHQQQQIQQQNRQRKIIQELEEQQQKIMKSQRQKNCTENIIIEETIDLCSTDEELDQDSNDAISRSRPKVFINNSCPLAQIISVPDIKNKDYKINGNGIIVNDDDDDDDVLQIVDECPVQLDRLIKPPTHLNILQFSSGRPPRLEVQTLLRKLNSENEITVTPLKKVLDPLALTPIESSSNIILSKPIQNTYNASNIIEEIRKQNKYEKNFLTSNITNTSKPMQPSVFLFPNYTANSTGSNNTTPTTTMILQQQIKNDLNSKSNNQENLIDNSNNSNSLYKNKNSDDIWLPNNNISNNLNNNISNLTTASTNNNNSSLNHLRQNNLNSVITNSPLLLNTASQLHNPAAVVAQATNVAAANKLLQWQINSPNRPFVDLTL